MSRENRVCEDHLTLDLAKLGTLKEGVSRRLPALHATDWEWQEWCNGGYVLDIVKRWAVATVRRNGTTLRVNVSSSSKTRTVERWAFDLRLMETPNAIGRTRLWFCCPVCTRLVRTMYFRHEVFRCRVCADLKHRSTVTFKPQRMQKRAGEIRSQIVRAGWAKRPRHMRRARFLALLQEYQRLRSALPPPRPLTLRKLKLTPMAWSPVKL